MHLIHKHTYVSVELAHDHLLYVITYYAIDNYTACADFPVLAQCHIFGAVHPGGKFGA